MMDLNLPVGFYNRWAPDANPPPFSAGLGTVHGGVLCLLRKETRAIILERMQPLAQDKLH